FASRGRGLRYGWDVDMSSAAVDRKSSTGVDPQFDSFIATQAGNGTHQWQIALPNGQYTVKIAMGEPAAAGSYQRINVEGKLFLRGKPTSKRPWVAATRTVTVSDGRLTVSNAADARGNALDFLAIRSLSASATALAQQQPIASKTVQAHGGSILYQNGVYYWYGEDKAGKTRIVNGQPHVDVLGISVYTSTNLRQWTSHGLALAGTSTGDLAPQNVLERPKVIYNAATKQYVMWMHVDNASYSKARVGVAVSSSPLGPFVYRGSFRPLGLDSRDMTVFQDDDGSAYLVFATNHNHSMRIARMTPDYLGLTGESSVPFSTRNREAPALFKRNGVYYLLTSGTTWFAPNAPMYAIATSVMGPYKPMGNPITGQGAATTYDAQGAFALQIPGTKDFTLLADRWNTASLGESTYVWLPLQFRGSKLTLNPPAGITTKVVS
ncbi:MAG: glycoside hydrolase family 43 protein, partial [Tepidisphaeraceae bacterium]